MSSEAPSTFTRARTRATFAGVAACLATLSLVAGRRDVPTPPAPPAPPAGIVASWSAYADSLTAAIAAEGPDGPAATARQRWTTASAAAVARAPAIRPPYAETGRFTGDDAEAVAYRVDILQGERVTVTLDATGTRPFLDVVGGSAGAVAHDGVASPVTADGSVQYVAAADGEVVLRLQPRLGAAGPYTLRIERTAALTFPVAGAGATVLGFFHDPRDGGARLHHGIDIAAATGTPVLAAAAGIAERVDTTEAGGLVVWVREHDSDRSHYYAHLDTHAVRAGDRVAAGTVLGTVGTTGNADSSTPHLHFGVYRDGRPADPLLFLDVPGRPPRREDGADPDRVGTTMRTRLAGAALRTLGLQPGRAASLPRHTRLHVVAAAGRYFRVRTADGADAFIAAWLLEPLPAEEPAAAATR